MNVITSVVMEWMLPFGCTELGSFLISSMMSFSVLEHWQKKRVAFSYLVERFVVVHKCKILDILKKNIPKKILKKRLKNMKKKGKKICSNVILIEINVICEVSIYFKNTKKNK